ncbi:MAG: response regulator [Alphaproteobacteria bacterium]|nr:response regulator [Alphaproteobacteria bacterium]
MTKSILIVDDDREFARSLAEQLSLHEGMEVLAASTGREALDAMQQRHFDAAFISLDLTGMDGRELCRLVRREGFFRPVVILASGDSEADQILALDAGANDYITKPFTLGILLARLRAHLRQHDLSEDAVIRMGPFVLVSAEKLLVGSDGKQIRLTDKETRLLKYLYRTRGRAVSQSRLLKEVWGYRSDIETHTIESHVFRLRQKIGQDRMATPLIVTEKDGYRLAS